MTKNYEFHEWQYNLLDVDDFSTSSKSRLRFWYEHIRKNCHDVGDILEFGVYRGSSALAVALILKQLGSNKKIYAFDSFEGFPSYSKFDDLENFKNRKYFSENLFREHLKFKELKKIQTGISSFDTDSIATSGNFSGTSLEILKKKISYFQLDNIEIIEGSFEETVPEFFDKTPIKISSCNIDCDLYDGYQITLPYVYHHLNKGGYIHLDEYFSYKYPGAKIAIDNFCAQENIFPTKQKNIRNGEFERWFISK